MSRQPDPELEQRILNAAHVLWKRGGEKALTMRAVAKAAGTNTPAVYRRFKDREDLIRGLLRGIVGQLREQFEAGESIEEMLEVYLRFALGQPHEYELFYTHGQQMNLPRGGGKLRPIRKSRPNFALLEERLAERLGGKPHTHTRLALALWAVAHGTAMLLLSEAIPKGHEQELLLACRDAATALLAGAKGVYGG